MLPPLDPLTPLPICRRGTAAYQLPSLPVPFTQDPTVVKVDMLQFLGVNQYLTGVSYDPFVCFPALEVRAGY